MCAKDPSILNSTWQLKVLKSNQIFKKRRTEIIASTRKLLCVSQVYCYLKYTLLRNIVVCHIQIRLAQCVRIRNIFIAVRRSRTYREENSRADALSIIANRYFRRQCNRLSIALVTNVPSSVAAARVYACPLLLLLLYSENLSPVNSV